MPTIFSHALTGFIATRIAGPDPSHQGRIAATCAVLAALPDTDAFFRDSLPREHLLSHRGLTHSILFAIVAGLGFALMLRFWMTSERFDTWKLWVLFAVTIASHGFFDAMTTGGSGIAFFAPFDNTRYFFPWRPIPVSPMSAEGLLTPRGAHLLQYEAALFGTFAIGAALWRSKNRERQIGASIFFAAGLVAWIGALR
jgi:inner membrane protein